MMNRGEELSEGHFLPQLHRPLAFPSSSFCTLSSVGDKEVISGVETISQRNTAESPPRARVKVVEGDPPMLRLAIDLFSWERGDCDIEIVLPHGGELWGLLHWAPPEQRLVICGNLRARIHEELAEVFRILQQPASEEP